MGKTQTIWRNCEIKNPEESKRVKEPDDDDIKIEMIIQRPKIFINIIAILFNECLNQRKTQAPWENIKSSSCLKVPITSLICGRR